MPDEPVVNSDPVVLEAPSTPVAPESVPVAPPVPRRRHRTRLPREGEMRRAKIIFRRPLNDQEREYLRGLGIKPEDHSEAELKTLFRFSAMFNKEITHGFCHLNGIEGINDTRSAMEWARETLEKREGDPDCPSMEMKIEAAKILQKCGATLAKQVKQLLETADRADAKRAAPVATNKPPNFAVQVNVAPANNGTPAITEKIANG